MDRGIERLEDVADILHEDIANISSDNDKAVVIDKLAEVEGAITARKKLEVEKARIEAEKPKEKTRFEKVCDFGKSWGATIAAGVTVVGVVTHEVINRMNLRDGLEHEKTGTVTSSFFRKIFK